MARESPAPLFTTGEWSAREIVFAATPATSEIGCSFVRATSLSPFCVTVPAGDGERVYRVARARPRAAHAAPTTSVPAALRRAGPVAPFSASPTVSNANVENVV